MSFVDAHTHLNDPKLFPEREHYIKQFAHIGGTKLVNVGANPQFNLNAIHISQKNDHQSHTCKAYASVGLHPYEVVSGETDEDNINQQILDLENLLKENSRYIVAIGECGVDLHYPNSEKTINLQKKLFEKQCKLAQKFDLPLIIHSRDAWEETLDVLRGFADMKIYFHCRGYGPEEIKKAQNMFENLRIGFCGNVTYKKAENLRQSIKAVNIERLLLETDAPYLTPQVVRGHTNHPALIKYLYEAVTEYLDIGIQELQKQMIQNFDLLYQKNHK